MQFTKIQMKKVNRGISLNTIKELNPFSQPKKYLKNN